MLCQIILNFITLLRLPENRKGEKINDDEDAELNSTAEDSEKRK